MIVGSKNVEYCVVHIRRGDYLNVAAKVITVDELTGLIQKIKNLTAEQLLDIANEVFDFENFSHLQYLPEK